MSKVLTDKDVQRKKRKQFIKEPLKFKDSYFLKRGFKNDVYLIMDQNEKIVYTEYSHEKALESLKYYNELSN